VAVGAGGVGDFADAARSGWGRPGSGEWGAGGGGAGAAAADGAGGGAAVGVDAPAGGGVVAAAVWVQLWGDRPAVVYFGEYGEAALSGDSRSSGFGRRQFLGKVFPA